MVQGPSSEEALGGVDTEFVESQRPRIYSSITMGCVFDLCYSSIMTESIVLRLLFLLSLLIQL